MGTFIYLFQTKAQRRAAQNRKRMSALTKARTAIRRERRAIAKRQQAAESLRSKAVSFERAGKPILAKQLVRQFVQMDKEAISRTLALNNMEYTLEQVQVKDNYDDFARGMQVVADIEEIAMKTIEPDEVRERLTEIASQNQDLIEPWTDLAAPESTPQASSLALQPEEEEAYAGVVADAVGEIAQSESTIPQAPEMDERLARKMEEVLGKE